MSRREDLRVRKYSYVLIPVSAEYSAEYKMANISAIFCTGISTYILAACSIVCTVAMANLF